MGGINGIVLQGDGTRLLSVGQDKKVGFWDLRESSVLERLDAGSEQRAIALARRPPLRHRRRRPRRPPVGL